MNVAERFISNMLGILANTAGRQQVRMINHAIYDVFHPGLMEAGKKRKPRIWMLSKDGLFVTCPSCSAINRLREHEISHVGLGGECNHCVKCNYVFGIYLLQWKKRGGL